jgi:hypothetical protein
MHYAHEGLCEVWIPKAKHVPDDRGPESRQQSTQKETLAPESLASLAPAPLWQRSDFYRRPKSWCPMVGEHREVMKVWVATGYVGVNMMPNRMLVIPTEQAHVCPTSMSKQTIQPGSSR